MLCVQFGLNTQKKQRYVKGKNRIKAMVNVKPVSNQIKSQSLYLFLLFFLCLLLCPPHSVCNVQLNRKWEFYASIDWILVRIDFVLRISIKLHVMRNVPGVCFFLILYKFMIIETSQKWWPKTFFLI